MVPRPNEPIMVGQPEEAAWSLEDLTFASPPTLDEFGSVQEVAEEEAETPVMAISSSERQTDFSPRREKLKGVLLLLAILLVTALVFAAIYIASLGFEEPECGDRDAQFRSCEPCGRGTVVAPFFGEYEKSWAKWGRAILYLICMFWAFLGMGLVCDRFMEGIEEITSAQTTRWVELAGGAKRKVHRPVWNATVANLTLMALGSSAPEILLSAIELMGNDYFAGDLGPSTIVGTAAFNLLVITGICISAIPAPEVRRIELVDVFGTTSTMSIWAYIWLIFILLATSPEKVEIWEGVATLLMFPVLVVAAFVADKRVVRRAFRKEEERRHSLKQLMDAKGDGPLTSSTVRFFDQTPGEVIRRPVSARAENHSFAMRMLLGQSVGATRKTVAGIRSSLRTSTLATTIKRRSPSAREISIGFTKEKHEVLECVGTVPVEVKASQSTGRVVEVKYTTIDGTAKAGKRFQHVQGTIIFGPSQTEKVIRIPIVDNDVWDPDEEFYVQLQDLQIQSSRSIPLMQSRSSNTVVADRRRGNERVVLKRARTTIRVINDDEPSTLLFEADEVHVSEGQIAELNVLRLGGVSGRIQCQFHTVDGSAIAEKDYQSSNGTLVFEDGESRSSLRIPILVSEDHTYETDEVFQVVLCQATPGVRIGPNAWRGQDKTSCDIIIAGDTHPSCCKRCLRSCFNLDRTRLMISLWSAQLTEVLYCNGTPEEQAQASCTDFFFHIITIPWKLLCLVVPPPMFLGGWGCFAMALFLIGVLTAYVGDLALLIGCCLGIPDHITAITLVALGTSLPDTIASKTAAQQDETADNSIGNVMGSNSVNVFLGIGISWTIGAVYWKVQGATPEWQRHIHHGQTTYADLFMQEDGSGVFVVSTGTLLFSVCIYTCSALACVALLVFRRLRYGGELGGPKRAQQRDSLLLICFWFTYVVCVSTYAAIQAGGQ